MLQQALDLISRCEIPCGSPEYDDSGFRVEKTILTPLAVLTFS